MQILSRCLLNIFILGISTFVTLSYGYPLPHAINFAQYQQGNTLQLHYLDLTDTDIPALNIFLSQHPEINNLNLEGNNVGVLGAELLVKNSHIQTLNLAENNIDDKAALILIKDKNLISLDLSFNYDLSFRTVMALAANKTLQTLILRNDKIGNLGANYLAEHNHTLKTLDLSYDVLGITDLTAFATNKNLTSLTIMSSDRSPEHQIDARGAQLLAYRNALTSLNLEGNNVGNEGAHLLASDPLLIKLELVNNNIGDNGVYVLADNTHIITLNLAANAITDDGAAALARNTTLKKLNLAYNLIGDGGAIALANNKTIKELILDNSFPNAERFITNIGAVALANNATLTKLSLSAQNIDDQGAFALAHTKSIAYLDLSHEPNHISSVGVAALRQNPVIKTLIVDENNKVKLQ